MSSSFADSKELRQYHLCNQLSISPPRQIRVFSKVCTLFCNDFWYFLRQNWQRKMHVIQDSKVSFIVLSPPSTQFEVQYHQVTRESGGCNLNLSVLHHFQVTKASRKGSYITFGDEIVSEIAEKVNFSDSDSLKVASGSG